MPTLISFLLFTFSIVQQPTGYYSYVSDAPNTLTQHSQTCCESIGLLAHNTEAGALFDLIQVGDKIKLTYLDHVEYWETSQIYETRAVSPFSVMTNLQDLNTGEIYDFVPFSNSIYWSNTPKLVLQTCIEHEGNLNWGRLFIVAVPIVHERIRSWKR